MCGIFCSISRQSHVQPDPAVRDLLQRRGPDSLGHVTSTYSTPVSRHENEDVHLTFVSTVLSLRGSQTVTQPFQDPEASGIICWNGEAWSIGNHHTSGNDTAATYDLLQLAINSHEPLTFPTQELDLVVDSLATVAGPYAFVFYSIATGKLYFGRDFLGRRSLLYRVLGSELMLSSVTSGSVDDGDWMEVEADGVYCLDLGNQAALSQSSSEVVVQWGDNLVYKRPYRFKSGSVGSKGLSVIPALSLNEQVPAKTSQITQASACVARLEQMLCESLAPRLLNIPDPPPLPALLREGLLPVRLAILFSGGLDCSLLARLAHDILDPSEPIDLLNVAFENPRIHKTSADGVMNTAAYESCPDRITGRSSFAELQKICPNRTWRFIAINIPYTETTEHRDRVVTLMHPHNTEMDLSIAYALYFAARGAGLASLASSDEPCEYTTPARVLLSGLGADELFAGYTRHATAYNRHGFQGLIDELNLDIGRLGKRNLGRDDRVISNWGREVRFPFLDERVVGWALAAPVSEKCDFGADTPETADASASLEPGKKVLRCLAWKLGMQKVAGEKKRAVSCTLVGLAIITENFAQIQFGARTAKMTTGRSKGTTLLS